MRVLLGLSFEGDGLEVVVSHYSIIRYIDHITHISSIISTSGLDDSIALRLAGDFLRSCE